MATTRPTAVQATSDQRSLEKPLPVVAGSKQAVRASTRWATGKTSASCWIQLGASLIGKNTPDKKMIGNIVRLATIGADSALRTKLATARPRALRQVAPSSVVTTAAGIRPGSMLT